MFLRLKTLHGFFVLPVWILPWIILVKNQDRNTRRKIHSKSAPKSAQKSAGPVGGGFWGGRGGGMSALGGGIVWGESVGACRCASCGGLIRVLGPVLL